MQSIIDRPQAKARGTAGWKRVRRPLLSSCAAAAMLVTAGQPRPARAQAFQATGSVQTGSATITTGTNTTNIAIGGSGNSQVVIDWVPNTAALAGTGNIAFMPTSTANPTTATFAGAPGVTNFTVLNNVVPTMSADQMRAIAIDGTIQSTIIPTPGTPAVRGGNVWFYSPGGIVAGATSVFNVGGLLLTSSAVSTSGGLYGNGPLNGQAGGSITLSSALNPRSAVIIQPGARINADVAQNSYVALVAPRVSQGGTVTVNGGTAYLAGEAGRIGFATDGGLVSALITTGSATDGTPADSDTLVHSGTTTGPASTGANDRQNIFFVALPKNNAVTMLLSGSIGYQAASSASVQNGVVVLGAGVAVDAISTPESSYGGTPTATFSGNIDIAGGTFTSSVTGFYTGEAGISSRLGDLTFTKDLTIYPSQGSGAIGDTTLTALNGNDLTVNGNLALYSAPGRTSQATAESGSIFAVDGATLISATHAGPGETGYGPYTPATAATGGSALLTADGGTVNLAALTLDADGTGGAGANLAGGAGNGGTATITSNNGGSVSVTGAALVTAAGRGGVSSIGTGGAGTGGDASVVTEGGTVTFSGPSLTINADGTGGSGTTGGAGQGGTAEINANDRAVTLTAAAATTDLFARGTGGAGFSTGGSGTAGTVSLLVTNTSVSTLGAIGLTGTGTGGAGPVAGSGAGNQIYITSTGGAISSTASITADARGYGGSNAGTFGAATGGAGSGGDITINLSVDAAPPSLDTPLLVANASGTGSGAGCAPGCDYAYGAGAEGTGGDIDFQSQGGSLSINTLTLSSIGTGGSGRRSSEGAATAGDGGDGDGGSIFFDKQFGDLTLGTVTFDASGVGGAGGAVRETGYGSTGVAGGAGGAGGGGTSELIINGGGDITGTLSLVANGTGGVGGAGQTGAGGAGGYAVGGVAELDPSLSGEVTVNTLVATANSLGGAGGASSSSDGGRGGEATNGTASVVASGPDAAFHFLNTATITANQTGGAGGVSVSGNGGAGGNGGRNGSIATARVEASGASSSMAFDGAAFVRADSTGGAGGASVSGNGGAGGSGIGPGSSALILASEGGSSVTFNAAATVSATTSGGDGGATQTGALGGDGGNGSGNVLEYGEGTASALATKGALNFRALTLDVHATGGTGGSGGSTAGGKGGDADAGRAVLGTADEGDFATVNFTSVTLTGTALGGAGGAGRSFVETGPGAIPAGTKRDGGAGGAGGDAFGGHSVVSTAGGTLTGGSVSADVTGTGGAGANGGTGAGYAAGAPAAGGTGGDGGQGSGGVIELTSAGGTGDLDGVTLTADGQGGRGGDGAIGGTTPAVPPMPGSPGTPGSPAILGAQAAGGAADLGVGGLVTVGVSDLRDFNADPPIAIDGRLSLGDTTISATGNGGLYGNSSGSSFGFSGRVVVSDNGAATDSLILSGLSSTNTGFAFGDTQSFNLIAANGPITVVNNAYVSSEYAFITATGSGGLDVGGELSINGYNGIQISHDAPTRDTIHAGNIDAFSYGSFSAGAGTVLRSDDSISINAFSGLNAAEVHAQNEVYGHTTNPDADIDIGIATADGPVDTGYGLNGSPPPSSAVTFIAGDDDPFVDANVSIHQTVSATGRVLLRAGADVVVDAGATVTSDNSVQIDSGRDVLIHGTVTAAANPLPDSSADTDPETSQTSSLDISSGTLETNQGQQIGLILVDGTIAAPGRAVRLLGSAIQVDNAIDARSLIAGIHDAPPFEAAPNNAGGALRAGCEVGNICLGPLLTTRVVEIGGTSGTDTLPNQVTLTGGFGGVSSTVRAAGDIRLGDAASPTSYTGSDLLHVESAQGSVLLTGAATLSGGTRTDGPNGGGVQILAAGDISGAAATIASGGDLGVRVGGNVSLASLTAGGRLSTLAADGSVSHADQLVVPGAITIGQDLSVAGGDIDVEANRAVNFNRVEIGNGRSLTLASATRSVTLTSAATTPLGTAGTVNITGATFTSIGQIDARGPITARALDGNLTAARLATTGALGLAAANGNVDVTGSLQAASLTINAGGTIHSASTGVSGEASLTADGAIEADGLAVGGPLTAQGSAITLAGVGPLDVALADARAGDLVIHLASGDLDVANAIAGGDIAATTDGGSITFAAANAGGALTINSEAEATLANASARTGVDLTARGVASLAGDIAAPAITVASADIAIDPAARIGIDTDSITLTNTGGGRTVVGGAGVDNTWSLSNAEFGRLSAHTITINAPAVEDLYALEIGQLDVIGSAGAATGSRRQNLTGSDLVFNSAGSALVDGAVSLTGAGADDALTIIAANQLNIITPGGSIALSGQNDALAGTLNLTADTIFVGSQQALTDLATLNSIGARNGRLDRNDGTANAAGFIQAGGLALTGGTGIYIQNTGTTASPDTRAGFTVGSGGVTLGSNIQGQTEAIINGRQENAAAPGTFITGEALIPLINFTEAVIENGLARGSTANSCLFDGTPCRIRQTVPPVPPIQDVINTRLDPSAQLAFLVQPPPIDFSDVVSVGLEPLIDDPVTGAGNEDMWLGSSDLDDDHRKNKAHGTAD